MSEFISSKCVVRNRNGEIVYRGSSNQCDDYKHALERGSNFKMRLTVDSVGGYGIDNNGKVEEFYYDSYGNKMYK